MLEYRQIQRLDLELSSKCNAACPQCPRNFFGYPNNRGFVEHSMTLAEAQQIFQPDFLHNIKEIYINGNYGDFVMNPESLEIIEYFKQHTSPGCHYKISTNGSARTKQFWHKLGSMGITVNFCLDGVDQETHAKYRRNTSFKTIIQNAQTFIAAGGIAVWKMIRFDHNQHQIDRAVAMSKELGFASFFEVDHGRNTGPIYDKDFNLVDKLGKFESWNTQQVFAGMNQKNAVIEIKNYSYSSVKENIHCKSKTRQEIFVSSTGRVYPCCFMGYEPETYERGAETYCAYMNHQLLQIIDQNHALTHGLENCINWFARVEESWSKESFEQGRLIVCNDSCGKGNLYAPAKVHTN